MQVDSGTDYRELLKAEYKRRHVVNPKYSLRAFARDAGLSPGFASLLFKGTKSISPEKAVDVAERLGFSQGEIADLCRLVQVTNSPSVKLRALFSEPSPTGPADETPSSLSLDAFHAIADWYHYGILELSCCTGFKGDPAAIALELGISENDARSALDRLVRLGLLEARRGTYVKASSFVATPSDRSSEALKHFHAQMITKAKDALFEQSVEERDITAITLPIDPRRMQIAKDEIRKFRRRMSRLLGSDRSTSVYQLNIQFFRLNKKAQPARSRS